MVRLAVALTGSDVLAEDLVQDAFVRVHAHWDRIERPRPYLRVAVVNACRSAGRRTALERAATTRERAVGGFPGRGRAVRRALETPVSQPRRAGAAVLRRPDPRGDRRSAEVSRRNGRAARTPRHRATQEGDRDVNDDELTAGARRKHRAASWQGLTAAGSRRSAHSARPRNFPPARSGRGRGTDHCDRRGIERLPDRLDERRIRHHEGHHAGRRRAGSFPTSSPVEPADVVTARAEVVKAYQEAYTGGLTDQVRDAAVQRGSELSELRQDIIAIARAHGYTAEQFRREPP